MTRSILLFCFFAFNAINLFAAPGDTTWVTVFENKKIDHYGNFDTTAVLPAAGNRYRKIRLHYILGRYNCPAGTQYCGSWDYTTLVYAKPQNADTVELARIITPYATDWGTTRKHDYIVDVTDYAPILNGNLDMQYQYEGYSWGFTLTLKIEYIEGIPPMDAVAAKNVYDGYFAYGNTSNPIENKLVTKNFTYNAPVANAILKNIISGHGSDDNGCGEFCSKYYQQKINGNQIAQKQLWKSNCGVNNISPQTGTWVFDRANWCPGEVVYPIVHDISDFTNPASAFEVNMDFEPYTSPVQTNTGGFNVVSQLITYKAPNHTLDASIEDVIAPTNDPNYARSNGVCNNPIIKVKNVGTDTLTSMTIEYQLVGGQAATFNWTGNLAFMQEQEIDLGSNIAVFSGNESNQFYVHLTNVNGQAQDQNQLNDDYKTTFVHVKSYPLTYRMYFKTNNGTSLTNAPYNETNWTIKDASGTIVASRINNANDSLYIDTLSLPTGCYTFEMTDDNCDGISWWFYSYYDVDPGAGQARFVKLTSLGLVKNFNGDFGCNIKERFTVGYVLDVDEIESDDSKVELFPNPAQDKIELQFDLAKNEKVKYSIVDLTGKKLKSDNVQVTKSSLLTVDTKDLKDGIYFISCEFENGSSTSKKFIIKR